MQYRTLILALLATTCGSSALADNFGGAAAAKPAAAPTAPAALVSSGPAPAAPTVAAGPQAAEAFRIVKPDGATVIAQGVMGSNVLTGTPITVSDKDAFLASAGKCAFNVRYEEVSSTAASGTTNRLYSNDKLIAQNTKIDLAPNVVKSIWTQPYLTPGLNNVRVVVNADGAAPSTKWIRVQVNGTCGGTVATPAPAVPATPPAATVPTAPSAPPAPVAPPPVERYAPGSAAWNNLNNMWGYSNYAVTQLKTANYARYAELLKLNAAVTAVINAKTVDQGTYNSLIASWNTFVTEPKFTSLMAAVVANTAGKK